MPTGHRGKALLHILDTFPRDELFESDDPDLARTAIGILNLQDRQRVRFFLRRDTFRRFFSCLVFVPRETLHDRRAPQDRGRTERRFRRHVGRLERADLRLTAGATAHDRAHTAEGERPRISIHDIERRIAEVIVSWSDKLRDEMLEAFGDDEGHKLFRIYGGVFPAGYQEDTDSQGRLQRHQLDRQDAVKAGERRSGRAV